MSLADTFLTEAGDAGKQVLELEAGLVAACARARRALPALALTDEAFARHLGRAVAAETDEPLTDLEALQLEDLFLAGACLARTDGALDAFEARCGERIRAALAANIASPEARGEVAQRLRDAVFVGTVDTPPKLASYSGRGPLDRWSAIVAQRLALMMMRSESTGRRAHERASLEAAILPGEPEIELAKEQYRSQFEEAFTEALGILNEKDRLLLRLHLVSGVSVEGIGKMYQVSQSTASRWLASAREAVATEVQRLLADRLSLARSEMASLARIVASQIDLSMSRLLAP
ncbi:MAG: putative DNA-binding regulatory protein [Myxococcales bacterium]|nr:putative DNA-binding regulatory protein [Myxococcales bacterium]